MSQHDAAPLKLEHQSQKFGEVRLFITSLHLFFQSQCSPVVAAVEAVRLYQISFLRLETVQEASSFSWICSHHSELTGTVGEGETVLSGP